uniref:G_PROTEIN_RECEP_F1_2 domain-containing protein n=1 Tax=Bursaphelenchus xylophilus TaxID=6326 RepID=A0A1I7S9I6_BURXY
MVALGGNILVCAAVFFDRKLRRQPENLFLVSLAVSDLLVSILVMVFAAANDILGYWPFGEAYCEFWICFDIASCTASILNLCAIAFDRYCHISRPMKYARYSSKRLIIAVIGVVWILSSLIGAAQVIFGEASGAEHQHAHRPRHAVFGKDGYHRLPTCQLRLSPLYAIVSSILSFFLPATIMVVLYLKLYLYARMHVRSIRSQLKQATHAALDYQDVGCNNNSAESSPNNNSGTANGTAASPRAVQPKYQMTAGQQYPGQNVETTIFPDIPEGCKRPNPKAQSVSDQKARLTLGIIMGTFLLCWLPFFVVNIWRSLFPNFFPTQVFQVVTWLGYANSTANPIIYGIFNRDFRRAFKRIVVKLLYCYDDVRKPSHFFGTSHAEQTLPLHRFSN